VPRERGLTYAAADRPGGACIGGDARALQSGERPDQPEMQISDFATEADAKNWITNDSWVWLKKLGYGE
jgi:hypothetical protein